MMIPPNIKTISVLDFEFTTLGGNVRPVSVVIREQDLQSRIHGKPEYINIWRPEKNSPTPFAFGKNDLLITFFAEAEYWCLDYLGWKLPPNHFDCYVENRNLFNGLLPKQPKKIWGLEETVNRLRIKTDYLADDKTDLRARIGRGDFEESERDNILRYNKADVAATYKLFLELLDVIGKDETLDNDRYWRQALLRGRQAAAFGKIAHTGIPVDVPAVKAFKAKRESIVETLVEEANEKLKLWHHGKFSRERFKELLERNNLLSQWPRTPSGALSTAAKVLDSYEDYDDIFLFGQIQSFRNSTKLGDIPLDEETGRAKCYISMFNNITSRAGPSTAKYLPNMSGCFKPFIKPEKDCCIIERDWEQQEFLVGARLSGDKKMEAAYNSGDPYLALGKEAGVIPDWADDKHPKRDVFKTVCLQLQYGSGTRSIAQRLRTTFDEANLFVNHHKRVFSKFWDWGEGNENHVLASWKLETKFGWQYQLKIGSAPRVHGEQDGFSLNTLRNWPCQAAGCEMLRLAVIMAHEKGLEIIAVVHDCIIIHCQKDKAAEHDKLLEECMKEASIQVIGCDTRTEKKQINYPDTFPVKKEKHMPIYLRIKELAGF